jgi:hypothetical protein
LCLPYKYQLDLLSLPLPTVVPPKEGEKCPLVLITSNLLPDCPPFQFFPEVPGTTSPVAILPCA